MGSSEDLYEMEDIVKKKYMDIIKNMSRVELKKFSPGEYQKLVLSDLTKALPSTDGSRLKETAQCILNAIEREAKSQQRSGARESAASRKSSNLLSDTVIAELDTTLGIDPTQKSADSEQFSCGESDDDSAESDVSDDELIADSQSDQLCSATDLDDSVTKVKKLASSIEEPDTNSKSTKPKKPENQPSICPEVCKGKPNSKKQHAMTRCTLCAVWFHDKCVGLGKDEPIGIWLCPSCRHTPRSIQNDVINLKNDVKTLKESTESILSAVQGLSNKFETCIGGINDRLTSLSKQINTKDKCITNSLENISSSTNNIKTVLDQKSNQILNKTSAVLDKLKMKSDDVDKTINLSKSIEKPLAEHSKEKSKTKHRESKQNPENTKVAQNKPKYRNITINPEHKIPSPKSSEVPQNSDANLDHETIALTCEPKKRIPQSTLLVGSSLLKGVRVSDLKPDTTVRSFSGARADTIGEKLSDYNIDACKTIILQVGGNDADDGVDLDTFSKSYVSLLNSISGESRRIIVSGLLPRKSVDLKPYNDILKKLCDENDIEFIDNYDSFLLASGEMPSSFYHHDKLHLNVHGTRRLLSSMNKVIAVTKNSPRQSSSQRSYNAQSPQGSYLNRGHSRPPRNGRNNVPTQFCHIIMLDSSSQYTNVLVQRTKCPAT